MTILRNVRAEFQWAGKIRTYERIRIVHLFYFIFIFYFIFSLCSLRSRRAAY